ncbi:MAG TPA: lysophospholipid acyltransferase family protein [Kiritimatiellia bacterium]|nr:lysophospholipid acyltransferase family protein [Kiritimatiellia bacterium]HRU69591.1 lysophospholipid acyltransferase family protein [Kiritimatiellia bacterium]
MASKGIKVYYRNARRPIEWLLIWLGKRIIPPLSLGALLRLSRWIGDVAYLFDCRGKAVAVANLRLMFGARMTPARERALVRRSYRNMARVLTNIFWMSRETLARIRDQATFAPAVIDALRAHRPAITVSAHFGNWEILSQAAVANGIPMMSVAKLIGSPELTSRLTALRSTIGQQIVPAEGALRHLLYALKHGTSIGLLIDQHTHVWEGGAWIDLFGVPAGVSLAPATLSRKLGVPIIFAWSRPLKDGRYRIEPGEVFLPDPTLDDQARTQQIVAAFEHVIRRHPSLWCLNYRRWKYILPDDDRSRYPFYARPSRRA